MRLRLRTQFALGGARINRLLIHFFPTRILTSAAKAGTETKPLIAAVNHCDTQNQVQHRLFPQAVKRCATQNQVQHRLFQHSVRPAIPLITLALSFCLMPGCSGDKAEEPAVSVQVVPVKKTTIEQMVTAQAILFPLAQSAIVPKISA